MTKVPEQPLARIAICCSGGGYRAAAFHLGAMAYLDRVKYRGRPLLENVKAISTVSGGTISGVIYALQKQDGHEFQQIYHFILDKLRSLDLIKMGLASLNPEHTWSNSNKRKNLINAFAEIYDKEFTEGATFSVFDDMSTSHLEEVMFNSTEFNHGLIFRFQNTGLFGNRYNNVRRAAAREVKLADVIAASSCFTGGFEPIEWPDDFLHDHSPAMREDTKKWEKAGLMDGGIYDNQGIDSIIRSEARADSKPFDLIIVSDVTSPYMDNFIFHEDKGESGLRGLSFNELRDRISLSWSKYVWILRILVVLGFVIPFSVGYSNHVVTGLGLMLAVVAGLLMFGLHLLRKRFQSHLKEGTEYLWSQLPLFYRQKLSTLDIGRLKFGRLEPLIIDRVSSLFTLVMNVFLKTVRRLVYGRLYRPEKYRYRRMSNLIRELTEEDYQQQLERGRKDPHYYQNLPGCDPILIGEYQKVFGEGIKEVAEKAASFGTTLWFTADDELNEMLDQLLASGQCSMCFNLLTYLTELRHSPDNGYAELPQEIGNHIDALWDQCKKDWLAFRKDPHFMVKELATNRNSTQS
ncbi:MAG: patatin-like phospholipase family protein [Saprospiraceae bacterium]|nr:patatin-like phospholipase family protein [Saprospiraceae bacterium]